MAQFKKNTVDRLVTVLQSLYDGVPNGDKLPVIVLMEDGTELVPMTAYRGKDEDGDNVIFITAA